MVTETDRNKARSAVVSAYHALDSVTIPFSFLHAFADAAVDALSTDAEPVTGRNNEAGYVEFLNEDVPYIVRDIEGRCAILVDMHTRKYIGYRVYDPDSDFGSHVAHAEPVKTAPAVAVKANDAPYNVEAIAKVISLSYGENPEDDAPLSKICGPNNEPLANWMAYEEQAKAVFIWMDAVIAALSAQVQDVAGQWIAPDDATDEMVAAALKVDWSNENETATVHNVWHAMRAASPASKHGDAE